LTFLYCIFGGLRGFTALMPGGDHLNIIDPPGLTVMRIAGGRYRVTAAHRVVWTWMNEFAQLTFTNTGVASKSSFQSHGNIYHNKSSPSPPNSPLRGTTLTTMSSGCTGGDKQNSLSSRRKGDGGDAVDQLQIGDLVTMTIVDVFETDCNGKLLSYCPTFDNRAIVKTNATTEILRKSSSKVMAAFSRAQKSKLALAVATHATTLATRLRKQVDKAVYGSNNSTASSHDDSTGGAAAASGPSHFDSRQRHDSRDGTVDDDEDVKQQHQKLQKPNLASMSFSDNSSGIPTAAFGIQHHNSKSTTITSKNNTRLDDTINTGTSIYHADDDLERHEI
jgi:hypothetical protein